MTYTHPVYPQLFKSASVDFIDKPYVLDNGDALWQQCYICGMSIQFSKDADRYINYLGIGDGLIRHKDCEPPPYTGHARIVKEV